MPRRATLFHWLSAAIALPCLAYSGRVFFRSAWQALRHGRTNMDVPISIGVLLAFGMSLYETIHHGPHAYFDAATSLLFFLLIGRTLDHVMRERARTAVEGLARLAPRGASVRQPDGSQRYLPVEEIGPGMTILLAAGDRVPVDGRVVEGRSEIDGSLASGESAPAAGRGRRPPAGRHAQPHRARCPSRRRRRPQDSFLAEMVRLMEAAEGGRSAYRRIADRAARLYAPVVHATAFATFVGWMIATGRRASRRDGRHRRAHHHLPLRARPCRADGPGGRGAAPVRARHHGQGRRRPGAARRGRPRRLRQDRHAHRGVPRLVDAEASLPALLAIAAAMARTRTIRIRRPSPPRACAGDVPAVALATSASMPGFGLEARLGGKLYRLGRRGLGAARRTTRPARESCWPQDGRLLCRFAFEDELRAGAREAVAALLAQGLPVEIALRRSRGAGAAARRVARRAVPRRRVAGRKGRPHRRARGGGPAVLMVGDGLNDAPALAAAHVSMAPASAADIGRNAADFVFLREISQAVPQAIEIARRGARAGPAELRCSPSPTMRSPCRSPSPAR